MDKFSLAETIYNTSILCNNFENALIKTSEGKCAYVSMDIKNVLSSIEQNSLIHYGDGFWFDGPTRDDVEVKIGSDRLDCFNKFILYPFYDYVYIKYKNPLKINICFVPQYIRDEIHSYLKDFYTQ